MIRSQPVIKVSKEIIVHVRCWVIVAELVLLYCQRIWSRVQVAVQSLLALMAFEVQLPRHCLLQQIQSSLELKSMILFQRLSTRQSQWLVTLPVRHCQSGHNLPIHQSLDIHETQLPYTTTPVEKEPLTTDNLIVQTKERSKPYLGTLVQAWL